MDKLREAVERALDQAIAAYVVKEVIRLYRELPIACDVFFCGSKRGLKPALETLTKLNGNGFSFRVFFSEGARRILDTKAICQVLNLPEERENQYRSESDKPPELLLLPTMTVNTATKIASCIGDAIAPAAVSDALVAGRPVIACTDGALPLGCEGNYRQALEQNLNRIRGYGVQLTTADRMETELRRIRALLRGLTGGLPGGSINPEQRRINESVITSSLLLGLSSKSTVVISPGAVVTPLAADYARAHQITFKTQ